MRYWKHTSSMTSRDLILKERNSYVLLESITSLISDLETICLDSGIVRDSGHAIENVVYFELLRRGYDVSIGKVDNSEVGFIATKVDDKLYVQVTESMYINTPVPVARKKLSNIRCID